MESLEWRLLKRMNLEVSISFQFVILLFNREKDVGEKQIILTGIADDDTVLLNQNFHWFSPFQMMIISVTIIISMIRIEALELELSFFQNDLLCFCHF